MKKIIASLFALTLASKLMAVSYSVTCFPYMSTNILPVTASGSIKVTAVSVNASSGTNTTLSLVDATTATNFVTTIAAYTNNIQYVTNYITTYTNFFGVTTSLTNAAVLTVANPVAASTYTAPIRASFSALASTTTTATPVNYLFEYGCQVTNSSLGAATITVQYVQ